MMRSHRQITDVEELLKMARQLVGEDDRIAEACFTRCVLACRLSKNVCCSNIIVHFAELCHSIRHIQRRWQRYAPLCLSDIFFFM